MNRSCPQRGFAVLAALVAALAVVGTAACSSDSSSGSSSTAVTLAPAGSPSSSTSTSAPVPSTTPETLPASVDPGSGAFVLGGALVRFGVTECTLTPQTDPDTGLVTNVIVTGDDGHGAVVSMTQQQTTSNAGTTVTDTVRFARGDAVFEATRFAFGGGPFRDPRDPAASGPLLVVDAVERQVTVSGTFGAPGSVAGAQGLVTGSVIAHCE